MNNQKILLVNVSKGRIGEDNSAILGAMIITKIQLCAMERVRIPEDERKDFYLYVDEFQNFATDAFESILSEARKFKLGMTVANQYINQLSDKIKNAVFGNVGTTVFFRVGAEDASFCKKMMDSFEERDFQYIKMGNSYTKLLIDGAPTKPFSMQVDRDLVNPFMEDPEMAKRIIENSRNTYGKEANQIELEINAKYASNSSAAKPETPAPDASAKFDDDFFADL
jgi:hypothetical protein